MKILIATPAKRGSTSGNRITSDRYARILKRLGNQVIVQEVSVAPYANDLLEIDLLIALHAGHSAFVVKKFKELDPHLPIIVVLTGTDIHRDIHNGPAVLQSLKLADRIVLLEPEGLHLLSPENATKSRVIFQSAISVSNRPRSLKRTFEVSLIGHLRPVKDPFLSAAATRLLPADSRIKIVHIGEALTPAMKTRALKESATNRRYQWLGKRPHGETQRRLARSRLTVLTSELEGAPSVISEAIVNNIPVLATRIDASFGLLGRDYPGLFNVHDAEELARLMYRTETDKAFYKLLQKKCAAVRNKFDPKRELASWKRLLKEIR